MEKGGILKLLARGDFKIQRGTEGEILTVAELPYVQVFEEIRT